MTMHPTQTIALHRVARANALLLSILPEGGGIVSGASEEGVRAVAAAAALSVPNATGSVIARMARPKNVAGRWQARVSRSFVQATPFLGWSGVQRMTITAPTYERAVRAQSIMWARFGPAPIALPVRMPNGRWAFNLPLEWARHLSPHMTAPVVLLRRMPRARRGVNGTSGAGANTLGQFGEEDEFGDEDSIICPEGRHRDLDPFSGTFGECIPNSGVLPSDDDDDVAFECPAGAFFDEFTLQCACADPAQFYDATTNTCRLITCPSGSHVEAGACVQDGGGGGSVPPVITGNGPPPPTDRTPPPTTTSKKDSTALYVGGALLAVAAVAGGVYLAKKKKKKGKRK
jgi:hypothetical protein